MNKEEMRKHDRDGALGAFVFGVIVGGAFVALLLLALASAR